MLGVWRTYQTKLEANKNLAEVFPGATLGRLGFFVQDLQIPPHLPKISKKLLRSSW